eukprot:365977-Chlamydomonas_euryale.AAC.3
MLESPSDGLGVWSAENVTVSGIVTNATVPSFLKLARCGRHTCGCADCTTVRGAEGSLPFLRSMALQRLLGAGSCWQTTLMLHAESDRRSCCSVYIMAANDANACQVCRKECHKT